MKRVATAIIVLSTVLMLAVILGSIIWVASELTSGSVASALAYGIFMLVSAAFSAWLGIRWAQPLVKRNREYIEQLRRKRGP